MPFRGPQNISIFRVGIKLGMALSDILKVGFVTALNRILAHTSTTTHE
jgi:hypothetical protein